MIEIDNIRLDSKGLKENIFSTTIPKYITVLTPSNEDLRHFQL